MHRAALAALSILAVLALLAAAPAAATWSVQVVDTETGEIGIASATCLTGVDLRVLTPVMVVGVGGAAAQSFVDGSGENRETIWDGFFAGKSPEEILAELEAQDPGHQTRQYGIVDRAPNPEVTFTGTGAGDWAGGVVGAVGSLVYAVQGNVLTGPPVVDLAERALREVDRDLPIRLMASMYAAYRMGGDGRCSCSQFDPDGCGSPPPDFEKSADVGYILVSRPGDSDGVCNPDDGCASGDYYMELNVAFADRGDPDPVRQLRDLFFQHRLERIGHADHFASSVAFDPPALPADGVSTALATISLADWRGDALTAGGADVTVVLDPSSTAEPEIGPVQDNGDGSYRFEVTAPGKPGVAVFRVTVDDGFGGVLLGPLPELEITP